MSISSPDDVDYIDTESPLIAPKMEEESSSIETVYTPSEKARIRYTNIYLMLYPGCNKTKIRATKIKSFIWCTLIYSTYGQAMSGKPQFSTTLRDKKPIFRNKRDYDIG